MKKLCGIMIFVLVTVFLLSVTAFAADATAITLTDASGVQTTVTATSSGTGWSYDKSTNTLTLNNWSGQGIVSNGDFNLNLVGTNNIEIPVPVSGSAYGLAAQKDNFRSESSVVINADSSATLNITGSNFTDTAYGIWAETYINNNVTLDISLFDSSANELYGTWGSVFFCGSNNHLAVEVEGSGNYVYGVYNSGIYSSTIFITNLENTSPVNNTANISVVNTNKKYACAVGDLYLESLGIDLTVSADNNGGDPLDRVAINSFRHAVNLTQGKINVINGVVRTYYSNLERLDNSLVSTTPANNAYGWINIPNSDYFIICDSEGSYLENIVFELNPDRTAAPTFFAGKYFFDLPSIEVGDSYNNIHTLLAGIRGIVYNGYLNLYFEVVEGKLPDGISFYSSGTFSGSTTAPCPAGSAKIRCTDRNNGNKYVEFTINYGAVVDPEKFMTVNGTTFNMSNNKHGTGWSYNGNKKTLTLSSYNGGPIIADNDFNLQLVNYNTIHVPVSGSGESYGIKAYQEKLHSNKKIVVNADSSATLKITGDGLFTNTAYGIWGNTYINNNVTLDISLSGSSANELYGTWGSVFFCGSNNHLAVEVEGSGNNVYGIYNSGIFSTTTDMTNLGNTSSVNNTANISVVNTNKKYARAVGDLYLESLGIDLTVSADNNGGDPLDRVAIDSFRYLIGLTQGGIRVTCGTVKTYYSNLAKHDNSFVSTTPANNAYGWKNIPNTNNIAICDMNGNYLENLVFELNPDRTAAPTFFAGNYFFDLPSIKVGESYNYNYSLLEGIRGLVYKDGGLSLNFEVVEGSLPAGIDFYSSGTFSGSTTTPCPAGSAKIRCTDRNNGNKYVEFTINYGAVTSSNPVTGLTLSQNTWEPYIDDEITLTATVTPSNAFYPRVSAVSSDSSVVEVVSVSDPVSGVTSIVLKAKKVGTATVTVKSLETLISQTLTVTVKTPPVIYGDVNGDSAVNVKDLIRLAKYCSNPGGTTVNALNADVDLSGGIGSTDLVRLAKYIANMNVTLGE